jgi:hypothetical protein
MEKSNQLPKTEGCLAEGEPVERWFHRFEQPLRSVPREQRGPQAGVASCLSNSASKQRDASGDGVSLPRPKTETPVTVRALKACRGLRAWRVPQETHETEEAPDRPAARTARAKRVCCFNDKKERQRPSGESDQLVVGQRKA